METLKKIWSKIRIFVYLIVAAVGLSFLVFREHVGEGLEKHKEREEELRREAERKKQEELARIEAEKQAAIKKAEAEEAERLEQARKDAEKEKKKLRELEKTDRAAFKDKVDKDLGVKEKKKGRPKKNV